jgi:hypothetical protein
VISVTFPTTPIHYVILILSISVRKLRIEDLETITLN